MNCRRKIKEEENRIRALLKCHTDERSPVYRAWNRFLDYFRTYDLLEGTRHVDLIRYIYLKRAQKQETMFCIAWKNALSERTLYRYRQKYVKCFHEYYHQELQSATVSVL